MDNSANTRRKIIRSYPNSSRQEILNQLRMVQDALEELLKTINTISTNAPHYDLLHTPEQYFSVKDLFKNGLGLFVQSIGENGFFKDVYTDLHNYQKQFSPLRVDCKFRQNACAHLFARPQLTQMHSARVERIKRQQANLLKKTHQTDEIRDVSEGLPHSHGVQPSYVSNTATLPTQSQYVSSISNQNQPVHQFVKRILSQLKAKTIRVSKAVSSKFEEAERWHIRFLQHNVSGSLVEPIKQLIFSFERELKKQYEKIMYYLYEVYNAQVQSVERQQQYKMQLSFYSDSLRQYVSASYRSEINIGGFSYAAHSQPYVIQRMNGAAPIEQHHNVQKITVASLLN